MQDLVSTEWLAAELGKPDLMVFDTTKYLPNEPHDGKAKYAEAHVPGADYFDIDWAPPKEGLRGRVLLPILGAIGGYMMSSKTPQPQPSTAVVEAASQKSNKISVSGNLGRPTFSDVTK